jgi:hypothetical protein
MPPPEGLTIAPFSGAKIDHMRSTSALHNPTAGSPNSGSEDPARGIAPWINERLHGRGLDRELGEGASPAESPALSLRAHRLEQQVFRDRLADALERAVRAAERPPAPSASVPVSRRAVRALALEIELLAGALRAGGCGPRGIALTNLLVTDGGSPLYGNAREQELRAAINEVRQGLAGGGGR